MSSTLSPPPAAPPASFRKDRWAFLAQLGPIVGLVGVVLFFSFMRPDTFKTFDNAQIILFQTVVVGTAALGMTLIIVSAGIDLSVGSLIALTTVVVAKLLNFLVPLFDPNTGSLAHWHVQIFGVDLLSQTIMPGLLAACGGMLAGALIGLLIGVLITKLKLLPFIVTLGMLASLRGLAEKLANEQTLAAPTTWINGLMKASLSTNAGNGARFFDRLGVWLSNLPPGVWLMLGLAILVAGMLRYTRFGRHVFAIGSNEQTARLCGVAVDRTKILVYALGGLFTGLSGVLVFSNLTEGDPTTAQGLELDVIAAVVIGGASLNGGQGSIFGTLVGALIMEIVANGCSKLGMGNPEQLMVTGGIIVLAVAIDRFQHRRGESRGR